MGLSALVGLGLAAAGTGLQMKAARDSRKAMDAQVSRSVQQQEEFQRQATPIFHEGLKNVGADRTKSMVAEATQDAKARYNEADGGGASPLPTEKGRVRGVVGQARDAHARRDAYSEAGMRQWLSNQDVGRGLGVISTLARGSAGTAPILTALAGNKGANLAGIGSLMSTAGQLATVYGGVNAGRGSAVSKDSVSPLLDAPAGKSTVANVA